MPTKPISHNPGCPCCSGTLDCSIFSTDFLDIASLSNNFTQYPLDSFEWITPDLIVKTIQGGALAVGNDTQNLISNGMSLSIAFNTGLSSGTVEAWVARDSSGDGLFAKIITGADCGTFSLWQSNGGIEKRISNLKSVVGLKFNEWHTVNICWDGNAWNLSSTIKLANSKYPIVSIDKIFPAFGIPDSDFIPGKYAAFGGTSGIEFDNYTLDAINGISDLNGSYYSTGLICKNCEPDCYVLELPATGELSLQCDESVLSGSFTKAAAFNRAYLVGAGEIIHETMISESPIKIYFGSYGYMNIGDKVGIIFDYVGPGNYKTATFERTGNTAFDWEIDFDGTKYSPSYFPNWRADWSGVSLEMCLYKNTASLGNLSINSVRPTVDYRVGITSNMSAAETFLSVSRHRSNFSYCQYCSPCKQCPGELDAIPDTMIVTIPSGLTNDVCNRCDEIQGSYTLLDINSNCNWSYVDSPYCYHYDAGCWEDYWAFIISAKLNPVYMNFVIIGWRWTVNISIYVGSDPPDNIGDPSPCQAGGGHLKYISQTGSCPGLPTILTLDPSHNNGFLKACGGTIPSSITLS